jgi:hypothetical protein
MRRICLMPAICLALAGFDLPVEGPVPVNKPEQPVTAEEADRRGQASAVPDVQPVNKEPTPLPDIAMPADSETSLASCEKELETLGVAFERLEPVAGENGCGIASPYALATIAPGVTLQPATALRCETALPLARWVRDVVLPSTMGASGQPAFARHQSRFNLCLPSARQPGDRQDVRACNRQRHRHREFRV